MQTNILFKEWRVSVCNINYSKYFNLLEKMPVNQDVLYDELKSFFPHFCDNVDLFIEGLIALNMPIFRSQVRLRKNNEIYYMIDNKLENININDCELCFVDIETTSSRVESGQIIEIGAIKTKNCKIKHTFNSLVHSYYVPEDISKLTGIDAKMLENSPKLEKVLERFVEFLGDCIFVAHNVSFDYDFISKSLVSIGKPPLLNARLCTLDLSRKTIISKKHALPYLNNLLGINNAISHRALADAMTSFELYKICALCLPHSVKNAKDLIAFSKGKIKYPKKL